MPTSARCHQLPINHPLAKRSLASFGWIGLACAVLAAASGCQSETTGRGSGHQSHTATHQPAPTTRTPSAPPLFDNLGPYTRTITTSSPLAQRYFNQGLNWMYAFNHDEAVRSFEYAAHLDPDCAMAYWGVAICSGPHINNPFMDENRSRVAWDALHRALERSAKCTQVERELIGALAARYDDPARDGGTKLPLDPVARRPFDEAYADAMARVYKRHPTDNDVATFYAESLMDLRPWDMWSLDGQPRPETPEVVRLLQQVLASDPNHPGANHLYIHAVEASPHPELADGAATRLRTLVPGSGHMVHMPAHIDVRTGRWNLAADQNEHAIKVHNAYEKRSPRQGFYRVYMSHNDHFLAFACMMAGRREDAVAAARQTVRSMPEDFLRDFAPVADALCPIEIESLMRFGMWDEILREPEPRESLPITRAIWTFARGVAYAAKGEVSLARAEQTRFRERVSKIPEDAMMAINPARKVLSIADDMLEGEILYREGDLDGAVTHLRKAIAIEDTLMYMEPPDWVQPVRHALGAFLADAGRYAEAEAVYREDLAKWPENGWSLHGLAVCLEHRGAADEAAAVRERFDRAWSRADTKLAASCFCVNGQSKTASAGR